VRNRHKPGPKPADKRATVEGVRVHVTTATRVLFFEEPRPDVPDSDYLGALDLSPDEVVELRLMAEEAAQSLIDANTK
jgi:hypothetical protein